VTFENKLISFGVLKPRCFAGIHFSKDQRPMCSANKDIFGLFSVGGLSLRHQQRGIAVEGSRLRRIKLDESNGSSKCLDSGKPNSKITTILQVVFKSISLSLLLILKLQLFANSKTFELCRRILLFLKV